MFLLLFILFFLKNYEYFLVVYNNITYLNAQESGTIFSTSPKIISYIHNQRKLERIVKGYGPTLRGNIDLYKNNFLDFNDKEKKHIDSLLSVIIDNLKKNYPKFNYDDWIFMKSNDNIEGGMPFTILNYIILPEKVIRRSMGLSDFTASMNYLGNILIHEKMHIFQRNNPDLVNMFYNKYWNFTYINNINIPNYINDKIRSNPDGLQIYWVYKNKYLILSLLNSDNNLSDINIYYYPIYWKNNRYYIDKPLNHLTEYNNFFCNIQYPYHPNESSAYLFSDIVLSQIFNTKLDTQCVALKQFYNWLNHNLG